jgi:Cu-Zn family superoxide dismutase
MVVATLADRALGARQQTMDAHMNSMTKVAVLVVCAFPLVAGCKSGHDVSAAAAAAAPAPSAAPEVVQSAMDIRAVFVELKTASGEDRGVVTFTKIGGELGIDADLGRLAPGVYGLRVHERGDCSAGDFSSAGDDFNPGGMGDHGGVGADGPAGDLGSLEVGAEGWVSRRWRTTRITLTDGENAVMGRAVVLHAAAGDPNSQARGAAGARIACAVIDPDAGDHEEH